MSSGEQHTDRLRAESFGAAAADYDRHRPAYPDVTVDHVAALARGPVLDVGCGTGRLAVALAARGFTVLGVEPDDRMAVVARDRGIPVETAAFEDWADAGRRFGTLTFATSWHWVDPVRGTAKAAAVLRPGGALVRLWYHFVLDDEARDRLRDVYREHAPQAHPHGDRLDASAFRDPVAASPEFGEVHTRVQHVERTFRTADWLDLVSTFSDHTTLEPGRLDTLRTAVRAAIDGLGGTLRAVGCTHTLVARRR